MKRLVAVAIAIAALWVLPAQAVDVPVPGHLLDVRPERTKFISKASGEMGYVLPGGLSDPIIAPWNIWWKWNDNWVHMPFNPIKWGGLGYPPGTKGYKYKGDGTMADPCKVVLVKPKVLKAICKGNFLSPAPPHPGTVLVQIGASDLSHRYCAEFGGTEVKNDANGLKRKGAPAPGLCASPSGAFVDDSSGLF
jgi:hypothetical protein